ncbi:MAG TPA: flagellar protein FlgN [Smithellaceae bacterium]|nr:flagellar protein FlgN [Smithellaceae bacterium]HQG79498.1 flagellar protein FlgN [Smithellaceae bacterium]
MCPPPLQSSRSFASTKTYKDNNMLEQNIHLSNRLEACVNDDLFSALIDVLTGEISIYEELKKFLITEKNMLVKPAAFAEINKSNAAKENIILKARISQEARTNLLKKIARNLDISEDEVNLISLAAFAGAEKGKIIKNLRSALLEITKEIETINSDNSNILDGSIDNVKASLEFLTSLLERSGIYLGNGKIGTVQHNGRLLRTEG